MNIVHIAMIVGVIMDNIVSTSLAYYLFDRSREGMARSGVPSQSSSSKFTECLKRTTWIVRRLIVYSIGLLLRSSYCTRADLIIETGIITS